MSIASTLPFAGLLLSIAIAPLLITHWWHAHHGKVAAGWAAASVLGLIATNGVESTTAAVFHTLALEYTPFILMLFALYATAGGIAVRGVPSGSPLVNTALLAVGAVLANIIGTTGASMVLIRPLIRANVHRPRNAHVVVFFIFIVANIGGSLTPLGDPPLFLGFLQGVDFFWTTRHLFDETIFMLAALLALFFGMDRWLLRRDGVKRLEAVSKQPFSIAGLVNLPLIAIAIGAILLSGAWKPGIGVTILGSYLELQNGARELAMIAVGLASLALTDRTTRAENGFEWAPLGEVAALFAAIFVCIIPVMEILHQGQSGPLSAITRLMTRADGQPNDAAYFWMTGLMSSVLDNAPAYLVFFQLAGGDAARLMGPLAPTLAAISLGAVYMGAATYIGNAPNFMVYAIARSAGMKAPSFFGYMIWSFAVLGPLFAIVTLVFLW